MIYLDNNATTFPDPKILERYCRLLKEPLGNPHSMHRLGQHARHLVVSAKRRIADWFGVKAKHVVITSGATEALNLAIQSCTGHLITTSLEHAAVREAVNRLDVPVTSLSPLEGRGAVTVNQIKEAIRSDTKMIVLSAANNETGICHDYEAIASLAKEHDLLLVIDAVAWIGKKTFVMPKGRVALAISGHKIHAPIGVGALVTTTRFPLNPQIVGGGQQMGLRGGTEMVALTDTLAMALEQLHQEDYQNMEMLRDEFEAKLAPLNPHIHGKGESRVSNVSNIAFPDCDGETLLMKLDLEGVAVSHGSACQTGAREVSHVLLNMGVPRQIARRSLRFSFSRETTKEEIDQVVKLLMRTVLIPVSPVSSATSAS